LSYGRSEAQYSDPVLKHKPQRAEFAHRHGSVANGETGSLSLLG